MVQDLGAGVAVGCKATFQILSYGYVKVTAAVHFELALQFKIHCGLFFFFVFFNCFYNFYLYVLMLGNHK